MLVNGEWAAEWHPVQAKDEKGGFVRQTSSFRTG
jgi:putative glutathione S-transferase